jgi:hypothetical protein
MIRVACLLRIVRDVGARHRNERRRSMLWLVELL